jgi:transcriptional regulator with XRE-family HTH domain
VVETMSVIGDNVLLWRRVRQLTQMQLAVKAGLNVSIISQIEQGRNEDPRGSTLLALAVALETTVDELLRPPVRVRKVMPLPPLPPEPPPSEGKRRKPRKGE